MTYDNIKSHKNQGFTLSLEYVFRKTTGGRSKLPPIPPAVLVLKNKKNDKNSKQCNDLQDRNVDKSEPKETNNQSRWKLGTCSVISNSRMKGIKEKQLSQKHGNVKVFHFSGARIEDINQYIILIIKKQPDY